MIKSSVIIVLFLLLFSGCSLTTPEIMHYRPSVHTYKFSITDGDGKPLAGASISATLYNQTSRIKDTVVTTDQSGHAVMLLTASADTTDQYQNAFDSRCEYSVSENGYLPEYGTRQIRYVLTDLNMRGDKGLNESSAEVVLNKVENIVDKSIDGVSPPELRTSLLNTLQQIHHEFAFKGMKLPPHSAGLVDHAGETTLNIVINTGNVLNTDVLTEDQMVQALFELAGRPTFEVLRNNLENLGSIKVYSLMLHAKKRSFTNKKEDFVPVDGLYVVRRELFDHADAEASNLKFLEGASITVNGVAYHVKK